MIGSPGGYRGHGLREGGLACEEPAGDGGSTGGGGL
jgi:hypothetical protein